MASSFIILLHTPVLSFQKKPQERDPRPIKKIKPLFLKVISIYLLFFSLAVYILALLLLFHQITEHRVLIRIIKRIVKSILTSKGE